MVKKAQIHYSLSGKISSCGTTTDPDKITDNIGVVTCSRCLKTKAGFAALSELESAGEKSEVLEINPSSQEAPVKVVASERNAFDIIRELKALQADYFNRITKVSIDSDGAISAEVHWVIRSLLGESTYNEFLVWFAESK